MNALQLMIKTYKETPGFGNPAKFQEELNILTQNLNKLEKDLATLKRDYDLVESKMNMNIRHSLLTSNARSLLSIDIANSCSNSSMSDVSESLENFEHESGNEAHKYGQTYETEKVETEPVYPLENEGINESEIHSSTPLSDYSDANIKSEYPSIPLMKLIALYSYEGEEEGTLSMDLGDEFEVLGEDTRGWIHVRRAGFIEEGFIPTGYTQPW